MTHEEQGDDTPSKGMFHDCLHECGELVMWDSFSNRWVHDSGNIYCDMEGESYLEAHPHSKRGED